MTGKTHLLAGILAGELLTAHLGFQLISIPSALVTGAAAFGSLLPDIDHATSTISNANRVTKTVSKAVTAVSRHRGVVHTPAFVFIIVGLLSLTSVFGWTYGWQTALGLAVGMVSHLVLDSLNPAGVMWLWPLLKDPVHFAKIRTRSKAEKVFMALVFAAIAVVTWNRLKSGLTTAF